MQNKVEELPLCLHLMDVARIMGVGRNLALKITRRKGFPVIREGRKIIVPRDAFFRWLYSHGEY